MLQTAVETEFGLVTFFKSKGATVSLWLLQSSTTRQDLK